MANLKTITFESNVFTGTSDSFDLSTGTVSVLSATAIKGTYYGKGTAASSYGKEQFTALDEVFVSFYFRPLTVPGSTGRIFEVRNSGGGSAYISVRYSNAGQIRLYNAAGTQIGSNVAVTLNTIYRIGVRWKKGTGANSIGELYVATGDTAFSGTPDASFTNGADTVQVAEVRIGSVTSTFIDFEFDDVLIDDASMPPPSTGSTQVDKTYTLAASFQSLVAKTYTLAASFQATVEKPYTLSASFLLVPEKAYTLAASFQALVTKTYTVAASFQAVNVEKTYTLAASFIFVVDKTYTLAASFNAVVTKTYTLTAAFVGQVDKPYTLTASFRNVIDKTYTLAASFSLLPEKAYTLAASFAVTPAQIVFPLGSSLLALPVETIAYITDEFGQGATVLPFITAKYTGIVNGIGSFSMTLPSSFPLSLLREDCWIEFWRSYNGSPLYLDMNKGFYLKTVEKRLDGKGVITITGPSHSDILNTRSIAYGKRTAQTLKTMAADSMLVDLVNDNLSTPATDPKRRIATAYFSVKPAAGIAPVIEREFTNAKLFSSLMDVVKQSRDQGTRLFFDIVRVASGLLEFRTYINHTGIDRSQTGQTLILSYENGNLDNVRIGVDYAKRASVVYALGAGSGDNRLVSGYEDTGYTNVSPIARKEAFVDAKGATTPAALVSFARSEVQRLRPRFNLTADIISKPDAPYGAWRLGDLVEISAETYTATMMIDKVTVELSNGIEKRVVGSGEGLTDE